MQKYFQNFKPYTWHSYNPAVACGQHCPEFPCIQT
jgi:hypothetical protein